VLQRSSGLAGRCTTGAGTKAVARWSASPPPSCSVASVGKRASVRVRALLRATIRTTTLFAARIQQNHAWRVKRCESFLVLTLYPTDRQWGMVEGVFYDTCHEITGFLR